MPFVCLLVFGQPARSQEFRAYSLGIERGLPSPAVTRILKDRDGFMWFGTPDGLVKYDGHKVRIFRHLSDDPQSLSDNVIIDLAQDTSGYIWIGTENGLNRLDPTSYRIDRFLAGPDDASLPHNLINALLINREGKIWIGTENGLCRYDEERFVRVPVEGRVPLAVRCLYEDRNGRIWVGTRKRGLFELNPGDLTLRDLRLFEKKPELVTVWTVIQDRSGTFWIGSPEGLWKLSPNASSLEKVGALDGQLSHERVRRLIIDDRDRLWIGTTRGVTLFDTKRKTWRHYKKYKINHEIFNDYYIHDLRIENDVLWIASDPGGVTQVDLSSTSIQHVFSDPNHLHGLSNNVVRCFLVDRHGDLWVGTDDGLNRWDKKINGFVHVRAGPGLLPDKQIRALHEDESGNIWIGTEHEGAVKLDPARQTFVYYPYRDPFIKGGLIGSRVYDFWQSPRDQGRYLWITTFRGGLNRLDFQTNQIVNFKAESRVPYGINDLWCGLEDRNGLFWLASRRDGVYTFDRRTEQFGYYRHDPLDSASISDNRIQFLHEDRQGRIWIGTADGLNCLLSQDGKFRRYTERHGLPNSVINGILEDGQGHLWISTNKGIVRMDPTSGLIKQYDSRDGLQGDPFERGACYKAPDGRFFFGGVNGFDVFRPEDMPINLVPPPVVITDFKVADRSIEPDANPNDIDEITLEHDDNFFSVEFAALTFIAQEKNTYAYRLIGLESEWNFTHNQRVATYTKISPGQYIFHVKAANNDGIWNEEGKKLRITILPPFWATWWFRSLVGVFLLGLVFLGYRYRIAAIHRRNRLLEIIVRDRTYELHAKSRELQVAHDHLELKVAERTRQLQNLSSRLQAIREDERQYLAREIHDELGSQLTALKMEISMLQRQMDGNGCRLDFTPVDQLTDDAIRTIQRISKELRPPILDNLGLGEALIWQMEEFRKRNRLTCSYQIAADMRVPPKPAIAIFRIFQELLTNVSRHSGATQLHVDACLKGSKFTLVAEDNGRGISEAELSDPNSIGLIGIRERLRPYHGESRFENTGKGTRVYITIDIPMAEGTDVD